MGDKDSGGNAENGRYPNPLGVVTSDGFPLSTADRKFGEHFFGCESCQIGDDRPELCPTGALLADRAVEEAFATVREQNLSEYLTFIADEHADDDYLKNRYYSTEELAARERRFMDAKLP